jgi:hypothetical protein
VKKAEGELTKLLDKKAAEAKVAAASATAVPAPAAVKKGALH